MSGAWSCVSGFLHYLELTHIISSATFSIDFFENFHYVSGRDMCDRVIFPVWRGYELNSGDKYHFNLFFSMLSRVNCTWIENSIL